MLWQFNFLKAIKRNLEEEQLLYFFFVRISSETQATLCPEKFKNGVFTLKTHETFFVHTEKYKNLPITGTFCIYG